MHEASGAFSSKKMVCPKKNDFIEIPILHEQSVYKFSIKAAWIQLYTPAGNYSEMNSDSIILSTDMRFSKKAIPQKRFHVILWITNEYVKCKFREIHSRN